MKRWEGGGKAAKRDRWGGAVVPLLVTVIVSAAFSVAPVRAIGSPASSQSTPGVSERWAFGGHASVGFSCKDAGCFDGSTFVGSYLIRYYIGWVVIYTRTNVSSMRTMIEGQAALNASVHLSYSGALNGTTETLSASVSGLGTSTGFTNLTSGTVTLSSASNASRWTSPALAILNASSIQAFNVSGSYSGQTPNASGSVNFDFGGHESSSVAFTPSLGIVPDRPQPGDRWNAVAPFPASGSWVSGYSYSVGGALGGSARQSNWTHGSAAPSGVLGVHGTDLGAIMLYDNYTSPVTSVSAQVVYLDFGSGAFALPDGWLIVPSGLYSGLSSGLESTGGSISSLSNETACYQGGSGFVGAGFAGSASLPVGASGSGPVSLSLQADPEPVGVAEQQYDAITSSGSSNGLPRSGFVVAVVIVVAALVAGVLTLRNPRGHRPPPTAWTPSGSPRSRGSS